MINTVFDIKYKSPRNYYILPQIKLKHNIVIRLSRTKERCVEVPLSLIVLDRAGVVRVGRHHIRRDGFKQ